MNYPALFFWVLIAWSVTASRSTVLVLLLASMPFASLALIPPEVVGMSILPQSMFAVVLTLKILVPQLMPLSPRLLAAFQLRHLGFLALFLLVATVVTVIMPKLFAGEVVIMPVKDIWGTPDLLSPTMQNFTQWGYVTLSVVTVFAITLMSDEPRFAQTLLVGLLAGGFVCVVTGVIDIAAASAGMENLLQPFRNADYAYLTEAEVAGVKRVVGLTPEASAYGPICVDFAAAMALVRASYLERLQRNLAIVLAGSLIVMALLSTSSTAYLGLAVFGIVYPASWVRRATSSSAIGQRGLVWELLVGLGFIAGLLFVLIAHAELLEPLRNVIEEVVFKKPLTDSYYGRSQWNSVAWETMASTWGLGVGLGSTRTSNWLVAVVSNAGLIGAACMAIFVVQTFARRPILRNPLLTDLLTGLKLSLLPAFAMASVSASGPDFGLWNAVVFGAIAGVADFPSERARTSGGASALGIRPDRPPLPLRGWRRGGRHQKPPLHPSF